MRVEKKTYNKKDIPKHNPFAKEVAIKKPYAVYLSPDRLTEYRVLKTFTHPHKENGDSKWLVAQRTMMFAPLDDYELKKLSRQDVNCNSFMVSCSNEWIQSYTH